MGGHNAGTELVPRGYGVAAIIYSPNISIRDNNQPESVPEI